MREIAFDYETHDPYLVTRGKVKARGPSCVFGAGRVICAGFYDGRECWSLDGAGGREMLEYLRSPDVTLIGTNILYDLTWACSSLHLDARAVRCGVVDISVAESLIDEYQKFSLDALAVKYLNEHKGKEALEGIALGLGLKGDFRQHLDALWNKGYTEEIHAYVRSDADQPWRIWQLQKKVLEEQGLMPAMNMNMQALKASLFMKLRGVRLDMDAWLRNCRTATNAMETLRDNYEHKYGSVNINSPKQLSQQFDRFGVEYPYKIGIKGWKKTDGTKFRNSNDLFAGDELSSQRRALRSVFGGVRIEKGRLVLYVSKQYAERTSRQLSDLGYEVSCNPAINKTLYAKLNGKVDIVTDLVQYKQAKNITDKFLGPGFGRYIVAYKDGVPYPAFDDSGSFVAQDADEYRLHSTYNVVGARQTGRTSSSTANLQQVPSRTVLFEKTDHEVNLARMCRECFVSEKGHAFLHLDESAQENRMAAEFAPGENGKRIREMYKKDNYLDEHAYVTEVSGLAEEHGPKIGRKYAKNIRFGVSYGLGLPHMSEMYGWDMDFAQELYDKVAAAAPWLFDLMEQVQRVVLKRRYIRTIMGRRIHLRKNHDNDAYKFMNYLIQGSSADMTKLAIGMIFSRMCEMYDAGVIVDELLLTVHDENNSDIDLSDIDAAVSRTMELRYAMENAVRDAAHTETPFISCPEIGTSWCNGVEWKPELGDCEEFVRAAYTAIKQGTFDEFKSRVKAFDDDDSDMSFSEFCEYMDSDDDDDEE